MACDREGVEITAPRIRFAILRASGSREEKPMTTTSKDGRVKYHTYRMWKGGQIVSSRFEGSATFHAPTIYPRMSRERIFGVDTESLPVAGKLATVLIPLKFDNWGTLLETPEGI